MNPETFLSHSATDTAGHARNFSQLCRPGTVIRLRGDLGAGKTTWIRALVAALGATDDVTSPTFSLLHEYRSGRIAVYHWDLYRLDSNTDWNVLELAEQLPADGLTVIEWPERYPGPWPAGCCEDVTLLITGENERRINTTGRMIAS